MAGSLLLTSNSTGSSQDISSLLELATYTASAATWVLPSVRLSSLNGAAATITLTARHYASNGTTLIREQAYSFAKPRATSTVAGDEMPAFLLANGEKLTVAATSSNASDSAISYTISWANAAGADVQLIAGTAQTAADVGAKTGFLPSATAGETGGVSIVGSAMALTSAAQQTISEIVHGQDRVYVAWATDDATSGAALKTAVEAASSGTLVIVGAGTFAIGANQIVIPSGVSVLGTGMASTIITSEYSLQDGEIVRPGANASLKNLAIHGILSDGTFQTPLGIMGLGVVDYGTMVIENVELVADSDGLYIDNQSTGVMICRNLVVRTKYDCVKVIVMPNILLFVQDSDLRAQGQFNDNNTECRAVSIESGTVTISNSRLFAAGSTLDNYGVKVEEVDSGWPSLVTIRNCTIQAEDFSVYRDAAATVATLTTIACSYDSTKASGTVTIIGGDTYGLANGTSGFVAIKDALPYVFTGVNAVTLTIDDGTTALSAVKITITQGNNNETRETDGSGQASFSLNNGDYTLTLAKGGYEFTPTTVSISTNPQAITKHMTATSRPAAADPTQARCYLTCYTQAGRPDPNAKVQVQAATAGSAGAWPSDWATYSCDSDADLVDPVDTGKGIVLTQGVLYRGKLGDGVFGGGTPVEFTPDAGAFNIPPILGRNQ